MSKFRVLTVLIAVTSITCSIRMFHCGINLVSLNLLSDNGNQSLLSSGGSNNLYDRLLPPIITGGIQNKEALIMFSVLCCHPNIWCIDHNHIVSRLINFRISSLSSSMEKQRLLEAGVTSGILASGLQAFLAEVC